MRKYNFDGNDIFVNDMSDWKTSIDEDFKPGDLMADDIVWELINALPPHSYTGDYFQVGEPHSHRPDSAGKYCPTYATFEKIHTIPEVWKYDGNCFSGETENIV